MGCRDARAGVPALTLVSGQLGPEGGFSRDGEVGHLIIGAGEGGEIVYAVELDSPVASSTGSSQRPHKAGK